MSRKDDLIHSAVEIIDKVGYQNFSMRKLAKAQNISDAAIYKHFKSKSEIVIGILNVYKEFFARIQKKIETENYSAIGSLEYFIVSFINFYESHPSMALIINSVDTLSHENEIDDVIYDIVFLRLKLLTELFQKGIDNKEFGSEISAENLAAIMIGTMTSTVQIWKMQKYNFSLTERITLLTSQVKEKIMK